ncbi:MAG: hypothetical protein IJX08_06385 [Clostridia bacterium]|nr:hypothetical protein [Clostridia bacterium]
MKKRSKVKIIAATALFVVFWTFMLYLVQCLLVPKYQSGVVEGSMIAEYYEEKTDHEVLMIGDCEVYENISTVKLYEEYGITSYIRGSAQQLIWHSYYLLEDTLRYETPEVVVFNVLALKYNEPQKEAYNRMTLDGMKWSSSKVNAILASMTEDEKFVDYVFPLFRYHARWSELTKDDFKYLFHRDLVTHNGYYMRADVRAQEEFPDPMPLRDYSFGENAMLYLDKMTALCKEKGIELVLIKAPTEYPHWYEQWDDQMEAYAEENEIEYINFIPLQEEMGLDMSVDTYDAGLHLNVTGAEKMSKYFGSWLKERYELTDYRNDPEYAAVWEEKTQRYEAQKAAQYKEIEEQGSLVSYVPAQTKETNILKNFIVFALLAAICLTLIACDGKTTTDAPEKNSKPEASVSGEGAPSEGGEENSKAGENNEQNADRGYILMMGDTKVVIGAQMAPVAAALGEPTKYFESPACAFQGMDKVYTYGGVVIRTYPDDAGVDIIWSIELKDDMTSTAEGVCIGDNKDKVLSVYGSVEGEDSLLYRKDNVVLTFFLSDGAVTSITYIDETFNG